MTCWLFSSKNLENLKILKERLIWGFWDLWIGNKTRKRAREFNRLYQSIKPFDIAVFQIASTGEIHAIGIIKEKFIDYETPVWPIEIESNKVLLPYRISFKFVIFSEKPVVRYFVKIENYLDVFGIGKLPEHEARTILQYFSNFKGNLEFYFSSE